MMFSSPFRGVVRMMVAAARRRRAGSETTGRKDGSASDHEGNESDRGGMVSTPRALLRASGAAVRLRTGSQTGKTRTLWVSRVASLLFFVVNTG